MLQQEYDDVSRKLEKYRGDNPDHNMVRHPKHYDVFPDVEAILVIAASSTVEEFRGYCMGNVMKYRLRAGAKIDAAEDIKKANFYVELFNNHKHLCRATSLADEGKSR